MTERRAARESAANQGDGGAVDLRARTHAHGDPDLFRTHTPRGIDHAG